MMSCKEITKTISAEETLGFMGRMEVRLHLLMCRSCSAFSRHMKALKEALATMVRRKGSLSEKELHALEDKALQRIKRRMEGDGDLSDFSP